VDEGGRAWLLEVNAFPDFGRSGVEGEGVVRGVWDGVVELVVEGFFGVGMEGRGEAEGERWGMRKVLDIDLGRR
jgi:tubulin--tyrosine ligase